MAAKKKEKDRCDANVRRQFDGMKLVIELLFPEIHHFTYLKNRSVIANRTKIATG